MDHIHTVPLATQVGGHPGVLVSDDGSLVIKSCLPAELAFYQELASNQTLAKLMPFTPKFFGSLKLQGQLRKAAFPSGQATIVPPSLEHDDKDVRHEAASAIFRLIHACFLSNLS